MVLGEKEALRRALRARRDALAIEARADGSRRIAAHVLDLVQGECRRIAIYAAVGSEVDTATLFHALRERHIEVLLPRCRDDALEFASVTDLEGLRRGLYGIPEPDGSAVALTQIDMVIVPGLAFDRRGGRLGYGKGYYDRTLSGYRGVVVGLAFSAQLVEQLPTTGLDRAVDRVVTEVGPA